jgi:hypothetical protein
LLVFSLLPISLIVLLFIIPITNKFSEHLYNTNVDSR